MFFERPIGNYTKEVRQTPRRHEKAIKTGFSASVIQSGWNRKCVVRGLNKFASGRSAPALQSNSCTVMNGQASLTSFMVQVSATHATFKNAMIHLPSPTNSLSAQAAQASAAAREVFMRSNLGVALAEQVPECVLMCFLTCFCLHEPLCYAWPRRRLVENSVLHIPARRKRRSGNHGRLRQIIEKERS